MPAGRIIVFVVGGLLAVIGLIGLNSEVTTRGLGAIPCGTAFNTDYDKVDSEARVDDLADALRGKPSYLIGDERRQSLRQACDSALGTRRSTMWPILGLGVVLLGLATLAGRVVIQRQAMRADPVVQREAKERCAE